MFRETDIPLSKYRKQAFDIKLTDAEVRDRRKLTSYLNVKCRPMSVLSLIRV